MATKLDRQHKRLAEKYVVHLNGSRAAIEVGYSKQSARAQASQILARPEVKAYVDELIKERAEETRSESYLVLEELKIVSRSDIRDYVIRKDGSVALAPGVPEEAWRAVASIEVKQIGARKITKVRLHPKADFLRMQGQHLAMFKEVVETRDKTLEDALDELDDADGATS
jgi:phage terminase small subunit